MAETAAKPKAKRRAKANTALRPFTEADYATANWCGPTIKPRKWRGMPFEQLTDGEKVCAFTEKYLRVPSGQHVGKPLKLEPFQERFLLAVFDNPEHTRFAYLTMARRNGKTFLTAAILLAYLVGPLAKPNCTYVSAALSRDQAALVFSEMAKMIRLSSALSAITHIVDSKKIITNKHNGSEYYSMSAEAKSGLGRSLRVIVHDEIGQIQGPTNDYVDMLRSSQGSFEDARYIGISTQAASDADYLSIEIDNALRTQPRNTVVHVYAAPKNCDLDDRDAWRLANPGLGVFRSVADMEAQIQSAVSLPAKESSARNLLLNQRISLQTLWVSPTIWKENAGEINHDLFRTLPVKLGIDLSMRNDLTAAVLSVADYNGDVHLWPHVFVPDEGLHEKSLRDRAPYSAWAKSGHLIAVPGRVVDYDWVATYLAQLCSDMFISEVCFDRWQIEQFKAAAARAGLETPTWTPVGQGYRDFSPRLKAMEEALLRRRIRHGGHPLLNMAAANAIAVRDPAGNVKLDKSATSQRIDPMVAAVMAAFGHIQAVEAPFDISKFIV